MAKPQPDTHPAAPSKPLSIELNLFALSGEIGLQLALPLLVFMVIGIKLDRAHHSAPLFILMAIALSLSTSVILIARMIMRVNRATRSKR